MSHREKQCLSERVFSVHSILTLAPRFCPLPGALLQGGAAGRLIRLSLEAGQRRDILVQTGILLPYPTLSDTGHRTAAAYLTLAFW
jgi:hypothetical protein